MEKEPAHDQDVLYLIELNEKMNEAYTDVNSSLVYSEPDKETLQNQIMQIDSLGALADLLQDRTHAYFGIVSCVACFNNYIFVGNH